MRKYQIKQITRGNSHTEATMLRRESFRKGYLEESMRADQILRKKIKHITTSIKKASNKNNFIEEPRTSVLDRTIRNHTD